MDSINAKPFDLSRFQCNQLAETHESQNNRCCIFSTLKYFVSKNWPRKPTYVVLDVTKNDIFLDPRSFFSHLGGVQAKTLDIQLNQEI